MPVTRTCRTAPKTACPCCGGLWWHNWRPDDVYHSCLHCGYVPEKVHYDAALLAELVAAAGTRPFTPDSERFPSIYQGVW